MSNNIVFIVANKRQISNSVSGLKYFPDCTISVSHTFDNEVTEYAVEDGTSVSDHVQNKNGMFSVSGIYNARPLDYYVGDQINPQNRIADAYTFLKRLRDDRNTFSLVSRYDVYEDCVVKSLKFPLAPTDGNTLIFEMDIVQVRKAKLEQVNIVAVQNVIDSKKDDAASASGVGKVTTKKADTVAKMLLDDFTEAGDVLKVTSDLTKQTVGGG